MLLAATIGLTAAILVRILILIATSPHSALILFSDFWQLPVSCGIGLLLSVLSYRAFRRPTPLIFVTTFVTLFLVVAFWWFIFNIPLSQQFLPGVWAK